MSKLPSAKDALAQMNEDYVVAKIGGKVRIVGWESRDIGGGRVARTPTFSTVSDMSTLMSNRFVAVRAKDENGDDISKRKPLFKYWMEHANRPTAIGFTIDPDGRRFVDDRLNLWQGLGVKAQAGEWPLLRAHIVNVVCNGNQDHADYLLRYIAYAIQNPTLPSGVVVVLRGKQGTGKGTLVSLLCDIFGSHSLQVSDRRQIVGNFNAHLMQVCFLFADEAVWAGDKQAEGTLKRMATEETLTYEPKGLDAYAGPNMLTIMMASNEGWVIPAGEDDRRFVVFDVSDSHKEDDAYFQRLRHELDNGGREAFLHDMQAMDLGKWHPRHDKPMTDAKADQISQSADPLVHWLGNILDEGVLPYQVRDGGGALRDVGDSRDPALARADALRCHAVLAKRHMKANEFWKFLDGHGVFKDEKARTKTGRFRRFPPLREARAMFLQKHPWWKADWDSTDEWAMPSEMDDRLRFQGSAGWIEQDEEGVE